MLLSGQELETFAGQLKAIAVASAKRLPDFPDLPTVAETLPGFEARGWFALMALTGTADEIVQKVSQDLIDWADKVFVMSERQDRHLSFLQQHFSLDGKEIYDLDVPDEYDRGDPELVQILRERLSKFLRLQPS